MHLAVVGGEDVVPEVAAGAAQHRVRVVAVVGRVVELDQQVVTLDPVVVPGARRGRPFPGEQKLIDPVPGAGADVSVCPVGDDGDRAARRPQFPAGLAPRNTGAGETSSPSSVSTIAADRI